MITEVWKSAIPKAVAMKGHILSSERKYILKLALGFVFYDFLCLSFFSSFFLSNNLAYTEV